MQKELLKPLLNEKMLRERIHALGQKISEDYQGKDLVCVAILKGAVPFFSALIQTIELPLEIDFVCVSSYGNSTKSSGTVKLALDILRPIKDRHVLLVEDIVDTGVTMSYLLDLLKTRNPASIKIATLLQKPEMLKTKVKVDYLGFEIGNEFVVGFGLDYAEKYRNLPYVAILPEQLIAPPR
jgi:hypoxanthine phosphoribosyltransferase